MGNVIRRYALGLAIGLALPAAAGHAEEMQIGFIDSERIFEEYEGAAEAQEALARESRDWEEEAQKLKEDFTQSLEDLEAQRLMLSEERLRERERAVSERRREYEEYVASIWGVDGKVAQRNAELTKPIIDKVNEILHRICTEEDISLVLDAAGGTIVYGLPDLDLTDRVLEGLRQEGE